MNLKHSEMRPWIQKNLVPHLEAKTLVLLLGEMGAGKTEVVKKVCEILKFDPVQSPTFSVFHSYQGPSAMKIHHVDLYRLKDHNDIESTGFWDLFSLENDLIFVEWANLVDLQSWPWGWKIIQLEILKSSEDSREIRLRLGI